jgi:hypothetical protein
VCGLSARLYTFFNYLITRMTSEVTKYIDDLKTFAKESEMFLVRCEKPDRKRTRVFNCRIP